MALVIEDPGHGSLTSMFDEQVEGETANRRFSGVADELAVLPPKSERWRADVWSFTYIRRKLKEGAQRARLFAPKQLGNIL